MPKLQSIRGNLHLGRLKTLEITLPISEVKGSLIVNDCTPLIILNLPQLVNIGRLLQVHGNNVLESIRLRSLKAAKEIQVRASHMRDIHLNRELTTSRKTTMVVKVYRKRIREIFGLRLGHFVCVSTIKPNDTNGAFISLF
ncbi:hypothetical protein DSO57_1016030 [Entomophthora muscae]|uniref:Uncharacterized protein n=1 Tax=Entomophthora muscae TaxID=34485 RepID=A0ACC2UEH6_9FUNG|nr:hypothetical protein DSO57_1016030 [Entomophthora muscae]